MQNKISEGKIIDLKITAGCDSGDPVCELNIGGVATMDAAANATIGVYKVGVFDLSVKAINGAGNSAVEVGNNIYFVANDTPPLSKKETGVMFGRALEEIGSGNTATINVILTL